MGTFADLSAFTRTILASTELEDLARQLAERKITPEQYREQAKALEAETESQSGQGAYGSELPSYIPQDEDKPDEFRGWSSTDKTGFEQAVNWLIANAFGGSATGKTTLIDAFLEDWAVEWREQNGFAPTDSITKTPSLNDLLGLEEFQQGAQWLPWTGEGAFPPTFTTELTNEDGSLTIAMGTSSLLNGVEFIELPVSQARVTDSESGTGVAGDLAREIIRKVGVHNPISQQLINESHATGFDMLNPGEIDDIYLMRELNKPGARENAVPHFSTDEFVEILTGPPEPTGGRGSGGGRSIEFDSDQLAAEASYVWSRWYLEEAPSDRIAKIVDDYMGEARSFWVGKGGKLDFDTFLRDRLRGQAKYPLMFRHKAPNMTEEQHIAQYANPISQIGLRPDLAIEETGRAVQSGAGPADQLQRVRRTSAGQHLSAFSQRLASTVAGLGAGARS